MSVKIKKIIETLASYEERLSLELVKEQVDLLQRKNYSQGWKEENCFWLENVDLLKQTNHRKVNFDEFPLFGEVLKLSNHLLFQVLKGNSWDLGAVVFVFFVLKKSFVDNWMNLLEGKKCVLPKTKKYRLPDFFLMVNLLIFLAWLGTGKLFPHTALLLVLYWWICIHVYAFSYLDSCCIFSL